MKGKNLIKVSIKWLTVLVILAAPLSFAAQSKKDRQRAKKLLIQADQAYTAKNYREAANLYGQAVVLVPNDPNTHYKKGFSHFNLKENDLAINEFTTALTQGFKPIEIYRIRAFIFYGDKNYDSALDDIRKGLEIDPNDVPFLKALGEINLARNALVDALAAFQKAAGLAPDDADVYYNMARIYFTLGDPKKQGEAAETALAKGTRFPGEAHYLAGDAYQKQQNADAAIAAYKRAINSKPDIYEAYINLADVYRNENRFDDAISTAKQGLVAFPRDGNFYTSLSWYYSLAGRTDDAVQAARAAVIILPNEYMGYTNLCRAYNDTKDYGLAISACNNALRLNPGDGETYFYLGRAYNLTGKSAEATKNYGLAVTGLVDFTAKNPNYSDGWYLLGNAYFADNQRDKAEDAYRRCLSISPKFTKARYNLGILYTLRKDKIAATEQYNALVGLDVKLADALMAEIEKL